MLPINPFFGGRGRYKAFVLLLRIADATRPSNAHGVTMGAQTPEGVGIWEVASPRLLG
jgi:hypothetical protein